MRYKGVPSVITCAFQIPGCNSFMVTEKHVHASFKGYGNGKFYVRDIDLPVLQHFGNKIWDILKTINNKILASTALRTQPITLWEYNLIHI